MPRLQLSWTLLHGPLPFADYNLYHSAVTTMSKTAVSQFYDSFKQIINLKTGPGDP